MASSSTPTPSTGGNHPPDVNTPDDIAAGNSTRPHDALANDILVDDPPVDDPPVNDPTTDESKWVNTRDHVIRPSIPHHPLRLGLGLAEMASRRPLSMAGIAAAVHIVPHSVIGKLPTGQLDRPDARPASPTESKSVDPPSPSHQQPGTGNPITSQADAVKSNPDSPVTADVKTVPPVTSPTSSAIPIETSQTPVGVDQTQTGKAVAGEGETGATTGEATRSSQNSKLESMKQVAQQIHDLCTGSVQETGAGTPTMEGLVSQFIAIGMDRGPETERDNETTRPSTAAQSGSSEAGRGSPSTNRTPSPPEAIQDAPSPTSSEETTDPLATHHKFLLAARHVAIPSAKCKSNFVAQYLFPCLSNDTGQPGRWTAAEEEEVAQWVAKGLALMDKGGYT